jgi:hypothetical protein
MRAPNLPAFLIVPESECGFRSLNRRAAQESLPALPWLDRPGQGPEYRNPDPSVSGDEVPTLNQRRLGSVCRAAPFAFAGIFGFATIVACLASTLAFTRVFALAGVFSFFVVGDRLERVTEIRGCGTGGVGADGEGTC